MEFAVKVYFKDSNPYFPLGGKMTQHLNDLQIGDTLSMKGPKGSLTYLRQGEIQIAKREESRSRKLNKIGMIAGMFYFYWVLGFGVQ